MGKVKETLRNHYQIMKDGLDHQWYVSTILPDGECVAHISNETWGTAMVCLTEEMCKYGDGPDARRVGDDG